jgi:hypothetical protein
VVNGVTYAGVTPGTPFAVTASEDGFWGTGVPPTTPDPAAYELGMKFVPEVNGVIKGIRFYKTASATGPFTGSLWSTTGALLATGTFTTTASGWQELRFTTPVSVTAGTVYVASYYTPNGNYAFEANGLAASITSAGGYITTIASGGASGGNGVFRAGTPGFPTTTFSASNYFVDVIFSASDDNFWGAAVPVLPAVPDPLPYELGMKFQPNVDGFVKGVRFYKTVAATGTFTGSLWSIDGTRLATGTFTTTASGWQQLIFSSPVAVTANTPYVVSYFAPNGNYAQEIDGLLTSSTSIGGNLSSVVSGGPLGGNGVFASGSSVFPTSTFNNSNYFVDPVFEPGSALQYQLTNVTDGVACTEVGAPIATANLTVNPSPRGTLSGNGTQVAGQPSSILFNPSLGTGPYSLEINGVSYTGVASATPFTNGVIPFAQTTRIWSNSSLPIPASVNDGLPVEVGMKFRPVINGSVTALRFYKGVSNLLPTELKLYTGSGTLLASVIHQDVAPAAPGWREVILPTAVALTANSLYVVSYYSASGDYVITNSFLQSDYASGAITVPAPGGPDGGNGVYTYSSGFPTNFFGVGGGPNYYADVVFNSPTVSLPLDLTQITDANGCTATVQQFVQLSVQNSLPVTLLTFSASVNGNDVKLDWSTASESNNRGFEIQRSEDGAKFVAVGLVEGAGNSQTTRSYTFTDRNRPAGKFFYRLKQVDFDDRFSLSNMVTAEINGRMVYELGQSYPNPTHGAATITFSVPVKTNVRIVLYDAQGRVVSVLQNGERAAGKYAITVPEYLLKTGMYYYKMEAGGFITTRKMIVQ